MMFFLFSPSCMPCPCVHSVWDRKFICWLTQVASWIWCPLSLWRDLGETTSLITNHTANTCRMEGGIADLFCFSSSLRGLVEEVKMETDGFPFQRRLCIDGHIKELSLTIGQIWITCSFAIVGKEEGSLYLDEKWKKTPLHYTVSHVCPSITFIFRK